MAPVFFLILWLAAASIPASIARSKGRSFGAWWLYGLLFILPATIHSLVLSESQPDPDGGAWARCPHCSSPVLESANVCSSCGERLRDSHPRARFRKRPARIDPKGVQYCNTCGERIGVGQWSVCPLCKSTSLRIEHV